MLQRKTYRVVTQLPDAPSRPSSRRASSRRGYRRWAVGLGAGIVPTSPALAAGRPVLPGLWSTGNPFVDALSVIAVLGIVWSFFYWGLYPKLLPHFGELGARVIFWSGFLLYAVGWLHLSVFTIYSYGFYYPWIQWSFLILVPLLSLWFLISFVRS